MKTANRFSNLIATALFGVFCSSFAALPAAADGFEPLKVTVKFADLDVSRQPGATVLYHRIRTAAKEVCSPYDHSGAVARPYLDACVDQAITDAVAEINVPALLAVYSAKTGKSPTARVASLQSRQ
jgi:UrcA family protein